MFPHKIHQPIGGFAGQATEIGIAAKEVLRMRDELNQLLAEHTGQPLERIRRDTERDYFMSAAEAQVYGVVDQIIAGTVEGSVRIAGRDT